MATLAEQLTNVQAAIEAIETGGQEITSLDGRGYKRADLGTLYAREKYLRRQINRTAGGNRTIAEF